MTWWQVSRRGQSGAEVVGTVEADTEYEATDEAYDKYGPKSQSGVLWVKKLAEDPNPPLVDEDGPDSTIPRTLRRRGVG